MRAAILSFACSFIGAVGAVKNKLALNTSDVPLHSFLRVSGKGVATDIASEGEAATLQRMIYWSHAVAPMPVGNKYLLFDFDAGGLNNIRMGWEFSGVISKLTGRTLVIPPPKGMYLLDNGPRNNKYLPKDVERRKTVTGLDDLLNIKQLQGNLPVISAEQFEQRTGVSWSLAKVQAGTIKTKGLNKFNIDKDALECDNLEKYIAVKSDFLYMVTADGRREGFMCGEWWRQGGPKWNLRKHMGDGEWALLQHGFVWHEDAFNIAAKAVNYLGLFDYVAMHARYNDFAEKQAQQGAKQLFEHWKEYLPAGSTLYVATDDPDKVKNEAPQGVRVVMWDDFFNDVTGKLLEKTKTTYTPERWFKLIGMVEELICTYSKVFVGTDRSSFTGHIQRMRIHAGAPTTERINHKDGVTLKVNSPKNFPNVLKEIEQWQKSDQKRKFKHSDASRGNVFLQTTN